MKISKNLLSLLVLIVLVGSVLGVRSARGKQAEEPKANFLATPKAMGNAAAKVRVIEFIDYQCPSCARASYFLHELSTRQPNDLYLEVKYFPLRGHQHSMTAAKLVECSRMQGKFWEAHNAVFKSQPKWRDLFDAKPVILEALGQAGVDAAKANQCSADPDVEARIANEKAIADGLNLMSTPTFFINGEMTVGFMAMYEKMKQLFPDAAQITFPTEVGGPMLPGTAGAGAPTPPAAAAPAPGSDDQPVASVVYAQN